MNKDEFLKLSKKQQKIKFKKTLNLKNKLEKEYNELLKEHDELLSQKKELEKMLKNRKW